MKKLLIVFLLTFAVSFVPSITIATTEGYDYYMTSNYVEFDSNCFSRGDDLYMYDWQTANYHVVEIQGVQCESSGCEIEIYDYEFSDYRYIGLEEDMCD